MNCKPDRNGNKAASNGFGGHHDADSLPLNGKKGKLDDDSLEEEEDDEKKEKGEEEDGGERTLWTSKKEYILSTIGFCVGIGNLFRFPYLCNRNGGGAFLIPFVLSLFLIGLPLFALEVAMGQFSGRNAQQVWAICPLFKGVGVGMVVISTICFWYYNTILAWAFYYLVSSFQSELPWASCDGWWNTDRCFTYKQLAFGNASLRANVSSLLEYSATSSPTTVGASLAQTNVSINVTGSSTNISDAKLVSAAEEFWQHNVLQISSGLDEPGHVVWYLAVALCGTLLLCFFALFKGVHSSGKVAYVTATAPYILLTILLVRGATLPGALEGVIFYIKPDFARLAEPKVWVEAALQVFYSLGPAWGGLVVMASYNKFNNNCLRDSVILTVVSEGTSIYGGFAIFSVLGHMAHVSGVSIDKVVTSGPGLAFIVYPEAISLLPLPQLWAVFFFLMLVTLAIDSQMTMGEVGLSAAIDMFPRVLRPRRVLFTAVFCVVCLAVSLPFITQGGIYVFQLVDWFLAALTVIVIGLVECLVVGWIYGVQRFGDDIELMLGHRPHFIFIALWKFVTPCLMLVLLGFTFFNYTPPTYGDYQYGVGGKVFGWSVALLSFVPIPIVAVYQLWIAKGSPTQRLRQTLRPDYNVWAPADDKVRRMYQKGATQTHVHNGCFDAV